VPLGVGVPDASPVRVRVSRAEDTRRALTRFCYSVVKDPAVAIRLGGALAKLGGKTSQRRYRKL